MIILRPIKASDEYQFIDLANLSHIGLTSLPKDTHILHNRIFHSITSFNKKVTAPGDEEYIFVLEDTDSKKIMGMSALHAKTGGTDFLYFFKKHFSSSKTHIEQVVKTVPLLSPVTYETGPSEVCSLYLHPDFRKSGFGKLLSSGRFLYIAAFQERFTADIIAELRGVIENDISPFWDGVGRHFLNMSFAEALEMMKYGRAFIPHFLPKHPIYISLLPQNVQAVIGRTHEHSKGAEVILMREGFKITDEIDIFDGGPKLCAATHEINTIKQSKKYLVSRIVDDLLGGIRSLLSNGRQEFRATLGMVQIHEQDIVYVTNDAATALDITIGDWIYVSPI